MLLLVAIVVVGVIVTVAAVVAALFASLAEREDAVARRRKPPEKPDPEALGEAWRAVMSDSIEGNIFIVWQRVLRKFGVDLADREKVTALAVYRLLQPVIELGDVPLTSEILREHIDDRVKEILRI